MKANTATFQDFKSIKPTKAKVVSLLKKYKKGIKLDVGAGDNPQPHFMSMDIRPMKHIDLVWDLEKIPYPLPKESCSVILASHVIEHINPHGGNFINVMNEWWRLLEVGGQLWGALPHGRSDGFIQDPTHCNMCNEATFMYFTPFHSLYRIYRPMPWKIVENVYHQVGNMNIVMEKMTLKEGEKCVTPELS